MSELPDAKTIGGLLDSNEGKEAFEASIDRLISEKRRELLGEKKAQVGQWIDRQLTSMYLTAEAIRKTYPKSAEIIDKARKRLAELLR